MTSFTQFPRQCEVYLSKALRQSGDTKKRPVGVVSIDLRNPYSSSVLVVPFSSDIASASSNPCRPLVKRGVRYKNPSLCPHFLRKIGNC
jgi:mRNA interferase MazF